MTQSVLVIGHRNPDNDSLSSAVGYAYLKNAQARRAAEMAGLKEPEYYYIPARLGPLAKETKWVLDTYKVEPPVAVGHVFARVEDAMTPNPISILDTASIIEAGQLLRHHNIRSLVVHDSDGVYQGLLTMRCIAERYISATDQLTAEGSSELTVATDLISSLKQLVSDFTEPTVVELSCESLLNDAIEDLTSSSLREAVVLDDDRRCVGILTRSDITPRPRRKVILVDHNESTQAAPGIGEAQVMEIIDHHRRGDITTSGPVLSLMMPVGSTATIISLEYERLGIEIPSEIAAVLLSAIMTDTIILKSPTTTDTDRTQADKLAAIAQVDVVEFGLALFRQRNSETDASIEDITGRDAKEFTYGDETFLIAQYETVDLQAVLAREDDIRAHLRKLVEDKNYEFVLFMITDIMAEGSQFICEGNRRLVNRVFGISCTGQGGTWMPGILSRKKQVAAKLLEP